MNRTPDFEALRTMTEAQLGEQGCQLWSRETGLMLFPASWFRAIPDGYLVETINGQVVPFSREMSSDQRWGYLAFGLKPRA